MVDNIWLTSALWIGLALASSLISIRIALSVALVEIMVGAIGGNLIGMPLTPWINYLASFGAILLTFLAGAEVDTDVVRRNFGATMTIGVVTIAVCCALPWIAPWFFRMVGQRVSEPEIKFLLLTLFALGGFATAVKSEAVLPAYIVGMALAPAFKQNPELPHRMRVIAF